MFGVRDVVWSLLICAVLTGLFQCRPAWSARRTVERDARAAFLEVYAGRRDLTGEIIAPPGGGVHVDPLASAVTDRRFEVTADRISWAGNKAELVALHVVELVGEPPERVEAHVKLEKRGSRWVYTLFEVRDRPAVGELDLDNPWIQALRPASPNEDADEQHDEDG